MNSEIFYLENEEAGTRNSSTNELTDRWTPAPQRMMVRRCAAARTSTIMAEVPRHLSDLTSANLGQFRRTKTTNEAFLSTACLTVEEA
ncbi:unnamed protein product [Gongylonema pulchrum]|uniref:Uncharacterized protein n=1 Tax=Gongylonema pulchrum TaxID=637853 RepID=A0A183DVL2_9BILA|nr:unnamed protein product [Gongylonema pulchrum]